MVAHGRAGLDDPVKLLRSLFREEHGQTMALLTITLLTLIVVVASVECW
jgi:hypothetical protein